MGLGLIIGPIGNPYTLQANPVGFNYLLYSRGFVYGSANAFVLGLGALSFNLTPQAEGYRPPLTLAQSPVAFTYTLEPNNLVFQTGLPNPIGINMSAGGVSAFEYEGFPLLKNRVRQGRSFTVAGGTTNVALDVNGWPAADWQQYLYTGGTNSGITWWSGTFQCGYVSHGNGPTQAGGSETIAALGGSGTVSAVSYNATTKQVLFSFTPNTGVFGYVVTGTTGGGTSVFAYLPEYNSNTSIDNPLLSSAWTTESLAFYKANFRYVRFIWPNNALYNTGQNTSSTRNIGGPSGNTQTHKGWKGSNPGAGVVNEGYPAEWWFSFCTAAGISCYYNWPVWEDGANGNAGSYTTSVLSSPSLLSMLQAGGTLYIEFADELWNGIYPVGANAGGTLLTQAVANGFANSFTGAFQYLGQKIHALANAIRASSLSSYFGNQIFIILASQTGSNGWDNFIPTTLSYMVSTYGAGTPASDSLAIATAPYMNLANVVTAPFTAFFTGSISGNTLTTTSTQANIAVGNVLFGGSPTAGTIANGVTVTGGSGTSFTLSASATVSNCSMATATRQPTVADIENALTVIGNAQPYLSAVEHCSLTAIHFGLLGYLTYEEGWQVNSEPGLNQATGNFTNLSATQSDSGLAAAMEALHSTVFDAGALSITNYEDGVNNVQPASTNYSPIDQLSASYPVTTANSPKLLALQNYIPASYVPRRNNITNVAATVSAAATADSTATGNLTPFNSFNIVPTSYTGGSNWANWWQFMSTAPRAATLQIGVVSGSVTVSIEWNGVVLATGVTITSAGYSVAVNVRTGANGLLIVATGSSSTVWSGFTF